MESFVVTIEDMDKAEDLLWKLIGEYADAETRLERDDIKEDISMQLLELTNLAWMRGLRYGRTGEHID